MPGIDVRTFRNPDESRVFEKGGRSYTRARRTRLGGPFGRSTATRVCSRCAPPSPRRVVTTTDLPGVIFGGVLVAQRGWSIVTQAALPPYVIGLILVCLMNGLVDRLQRSGIPRWGGTLIAILALIAAVIAFVWLTLDARSINGRALTAAWPKSPTRSPQGVGLPHPENVLAAVASWERWAWHRRSRGSWPVC